MTEFTRPRGTRDFLPEDLAHRRALEALLRATLERHGYREVRTPTFEHVELFLAKSGEAVLDEVYSFEDKGGRRLALRPELTAPVLRLYVSDLTHRPKPLKLYYVGNCFRYERPQAGRYREFWQVGMELLGPDTPESDAEVIAAAAACLRAAGLQGHEIRVSHLGILRALLDDAGVADEARGPLYRAVDKGDLEGLEGILETLALPDATAETLRTVAGTSTLLDTADVREASIVMELRELLAEVPGALEALDRLVEVLEALGLMGLPEVRLHLAVARGLDYYTGVVFEAHHPGLGAESQVCGGGAYALAELFGGETVGSAGFGLGVDRVLLALEAEGNLPGALQPPAVHVAPIGDAARGEALRLVTELRDAGVSADVDLLRRGPSKNLDHANALGIPRVILLGSREVEAGVVTLKDMASGEQEAVPRGEVVARLAAAVNP